jgi:hypothetical protein
MHFEGRLASGPEEICDLFAEFMQRTYTDDVWVPSDPGPEHVPDDPPLDALQFTLDEVESVLHDLDANKSSNPDGIPPIILKNCQWILGLFANSVGFELSEWCDRNSLLFNVDKCQNITFARSRHPVEF